MQLDVFISYASENRRIADAVCHFLEERDMRCWIAPRDIPQGHEWAEAIAEAIPACRVVVLVFSSHANDSPIVRREILLAVNKEVVIIPFRIENVFPRKAMELFISANHWLDAITPPVERHLNRLAESVANFLTGAVDTEFVYDPVREIGAISHRWVDADCPYHQLEEINKKMQFFISEPPEDLVFKDDNTLLMLMLAAIHFGANWGHWVKLNLNHRMAVRQLLLLFRINYLRPRLRALYALQHFDHGIVAKEIEILGEKIADGNKTLIEKYVLTGTVSTYIEKLCESGEMEFQIKAGAVMKEIQRFWKNSEAPKEDSTLPLL